MRELVGDEDIENLPINFTAVAADIQREKEVWINNGPIFDAIRASISLPLFFTPFERNGVKLIDGGVLNPVPIAPTFVDDTDITIAVNLGGANIEKEKVVEEVKTDVSSRSASFQKKIGEFVDRLKPQIPDGINGDWGVYDIINQSFDAMQSTIARQKLSSYSPDIVVEIARNACGTLEFERADEIINLGYNLEQRKQYQLLTTFCLYNN